MSAATGWYCYGCGASAIADAFGLDGRTMLGQCLGIHRRGALVPVTRELGAVADALEAGAPTRARRLHAKHLRGRLQPDRCTYCAAMLDELRLRRTRAPA